MKSGNVIQEKSYAFALRAVKLYQHLTERKKEFVLSKQVLRSGTSIGANWAGTPPGCNPFEFLVPGGVATLNHRLMAGNPTGFIMLEALRHVTKAAQFPNGWKPYGFHHA